MSNFTKLVMADEPDLLERVQKHFRDESVLSDGRTPMRVLRSLVSSPRLADYTVLGFNSDGFVHVGDSFLDEHTMLADWTQKTYGVELSTWKRIRTLPRSGSSHANLPLQRREGKCSTLGGRCRWISAFLS